MRVRWRDREIQMRIPDETFLCHLTCEHGRRSCAHTAFDGVSASIRAYRELIPRGRAYSDERHRIGRTKFFDDAFLSMLRHYFHFRDRDEFIVDDVGMDLPDLAVVRENALAAARDMAADKTQAGEPIGHEAIEVVDDDGAPVISVVLRSAIRLVEE